jgi:hypothetical protein
MLPTSKKKMSQENKKHILLSILPHAKIWRKPKVRNTSPPPHQEIGKEPAIKGILTHNRRGEIQS